MCRLAAYLGPELMLKQLLDEDPNSLITQSWASQELQGTSLNADGFGFGWYLDEGEPARYTSTLPIWSDTNLPGLAQSLKRSLWLAYVRSATPGQALSRDNTQPFVNGRLMCMHNGRIDDFNHGPRAALHEFLQADIAAGIQGNTDSEYLFAVFRQHYAASGELQTALHESNQSLEQILAGKPALVNMIISDGNVIAACRHAFNGAHCPSLYYTDSHPAYSDGLVIASERFSHHEQWQEVGAHSLLLVNADKTIKTAQL